MENKNNMSAEFLVKWNPEAYGDVPAKYVSMKEFIDDGIGNNWGIEEDDDDAEFSLQQLKDLELGDTHTVYDPYGWSIQIIKIREVA